MSNRFPILLASTSSISLVKVPQLILQLLSPPSPLPPPYTHYTITLVLSKQAEFLFFGTHRGSCVVYDEVSYNEVINISKDGSGRVVIVKADDEWNALLTPSSTLPPSQASHEHIEKAKPSFFCPALHIDLRNAHNLLLLCPLTANTLSKISLGQATDTLSCVVRAWDLNNKGCIICPAMNDLMWSHPLTLTQLDVVKVFWGGDAECVVVDPVVKVLACGSIGMGGLADVKSIVDAVERVVKSQVSRIQKVEGTESERNGEKLRRLLIEKSKVVFNERVNQINTDGLIVAPISPTPPAIITTLLSHLPTKIPNNSIIFDLGVGDGRWLIALANKYKKVKSLKCVGLDIDDERISLCTTNCKSECCDGQEIEVRKQSVMEPHSIAGIDAARIIVVYLFRTAMTVLTEFFKQREERGAVGECTLLCVGFKLGLGVECRFEGVVEGIKCYVYDL